MTIKEFLKLYFASAKKASEETGVPVLVTLAQAAIESGWGKHAPGNNFFGIKATHNWAGKTQKLVTSEYFTTESDVQHFYSSEDIVKFNGLIQGKYHFTVKAKFRAYETPEESFLDHGRMLKNSARYKAAFKTKTPQEFIEEVAKAGYATAPNYADYVKSIMKKIEMEIPAIEAELSKEGSDDAAKN